MALKLTQFYSCHKLVHEIHRTFKIYGMNCIEINKYLKFKMSTVDSAGTIS